MPGAQCPVLASRALPALDLGDAERFDRTEHRVDFLAGGRELGPAERSAGQPESLQHQLRDADAAVFVQDA